MGLNSCDYHGFQQNPRCSLQSVKYTVYLLSLIINKGNRICRTNSLLNKVCSKLGHFIFRCFPSSPTSSSAASSTTSAPTTPTSSTRLRPSSHHNRLVFFYQLRQFWVAKNASLSFEFVIIKFWFALLVLHLHKLGLTFWAGLLFNHGNFLCVFKQHDNHLTGVTAQFPLGHRWRVQNKDTNITLNAIGNSKAVLTVIASWVSASIARGSTLFHVWRNRRRKNLDTFWIESRPFYPIICDWFQCAWGRDETEKRECLNWKLAD